MQEKKYLTLQESAALLGIAVITFRKLVRKGVIKPEFQLGMNFAFLKEKVLKLKPSDYVEVAEASYPKNSKRFLKPPTEDELELLNKDLRHELDKTQFAKEKGITRQRLLLKIYSIAYRKMYFELNKNGDNRRSKNERARPAQKKASTTQLE